MIPADLKLPAKFESFRAYTGFDQLNTAVDLATAPERFQTLNAPTGAGKSLTYAAAGQLRGGRWLVLVGTKGLQSQLLSDFGPMGMRLVYGHRNYPCAAKAAILTGEGDAADDPEFRCAVPKSMCGYLRDIQAAAKANCVVANYAYWMSLAKYSDPGVLGEFDTVIMDECFVPDTMIGNRRIVDLRVGDLIPSFDPETKQVVKAVVVKRTAKRPSSLLRIKFAGQEVVCTPDHPILTIIGWLPAGALTMGSCVLCSRYGKDKVSTGSIDSVHSVRPSNHDLGSNEVSRLPQNGPRVLQQDLQQSLQRLPAKTHTDTRAAGDAPAENVGKESYALGDQQGEDENNSSSDGMETTNSGRQWETNTSSGFVAGLSSGLADRIPDFDGEKSREGIADELQIGSSGAGFEDRDRGGRIFSYSPETEGTRSEERERLGFAWVESIEVLEPGSDGTFGGLCPDGLVYNLEVEGHHTYIANGLAVHNCHTAPEWLTNGASIRISPGGLRKALGLPSNPKLPSFKKIEEWTDWAIEIGSGLLARAARLEKHEASEKKRVMRLADELDLLCGVSDEHNFNQRGLTQPWIVIRSSDSDAVQFAPRWGSDFAEQYLFRNIERVILCSATVTRETGDYLGIDPAQSRYTEVPSPFDARRRPVIWVPTTRVDYRMTDGQRFLLAQRIDAVIEKAIEQGAGNGLIHSQSYDRAMEIVARSKYKAAMITHSNSKELRSAIDRFKAASRAGVFAILVSPSIKEGFDFADELARWQVIVKVPFVDSRDPLTESRLKADKRYRYMLVAESVLQMCGRIVRSENDFGTTIFLDDHWGTYIHKQAPFPNWFRQSFGTCRQGIPDLLTEESVSAMVKPAAYNLIGG